MKSTTAIITILLANMSLGLPMQASSAEEGSTQWKAYVCLATDWVDCQKNLNNKRIYPSEKRYPDEKSCLADFEVMFEKDPAISSKYKTTRDINTSYLFACTSEKKPV
jgi:hypothetical protein